MERFLKTGLALREDIIKVQHNCKATGFWVHPVRNLLIAIASRLRLFF